MNRDQPKNVLSQARSCPDGEDDEGFNPGYQNDTGTRTPRPKPKPGQKCGDINFPNADDDPPGSDRTIWLGIIEAVTKLDITAAAAGNEVRECEPRSLLPRGMEAL